VRSQLPGVWGLGCGRVRGGVGGTGGEGVGGGGPWGCVSVAGKRGEGGS